MAEVRSEMKAVRPELQQPRDVAQSYRELASQCREMAKHNRRPGSLLLRAAALDASAEHVEHPQRAPA
jgi:hypothetical protein